MNTRQFTLIIDQKHLTYSLGSFSNNYVSPESRQLDHIPQFASDIQHTSVANNVVAFTLSLITYLNNFQGSAFLNLQSPKMKILIFSTSYLRRPLNYDWSRWGHVKMLFLCDTSTGRDHRIMPKHYWRQAYNTSQILFVSYTVSDDKGFELVRLVSYSKTHTLYTWVFFKIFVPCAPKRKYSALLRVNLRGIYKNLTQWAMFSPSWAAFRASSNTSYWFRKLCKNSSASSNRVIKLLHHYITYLHH